MKTGWLWHERFGWHDTGTAAGILSGEYLQPLKHLESSESKARFSSLVHVSEMISQVTPLQFAAATKQDLLRIHTSEHIENMIALSNNPRGGDMGDGVSPFAMRAYDIACLSAGGSMHAVKAVLEGTVDNAYALVRPPGHHARPETGMGFCMFANIAVAIAYAKSMHLVDRVAVVDWDVHHGNGTQACFESDPSVLTISIHQDGNFPADTGKIHERGIGAGEGSVINIPLPPGSGSGAYEYAFDEVIIPALEKFKPELIVVASGFDASNPDPLGAMLLTSASYHSFTKKLMAAADRLCDGKIVINHEGGYSPFYVPFCGLAVLEALTGFKTKVDDPYQHIWEFMPGQELQAHQQKLVDKVAQQI